MSDQDESNQTSIEITDDAVELPRFHHPTQAVRLLPMDLKLGGLHVSDFACRQGAACFQASAAGLIQGPNECSSRLGGDTGAAGRHHQAILNLKFLPA